MDTGLVIVCVALAALMIAVLLGRGPGGRPLPPGVKKRTRRPGSLSGDAERERAIAAQAEIEAHDIDEMVAARDALRRRTGRPSIGDELAEQARREDDNQSHAR